MFLTRSCSALIKVPGNLPVWPVSTFCVRWLDLPAESSIWSIRSQLFSSVTSCSVFIPRSTFFQISRATVLAYPKNGLMCHMLVHSSPKSMHRHYNGQAPSMQKQAMCVRQDPSLLQCRFCKNEDGRNFRLGNSPTGEFCTSPTRRVHDISFALKDWLDQASSRFSTKNLTRSIASNEGRLQEWGRKKFPTLQISKRQTVQIQQVPSPTSMSLSELRC